MAKVNAILTRRKNGRLRAPVRLFLVLEKWVLSNPSVAASYLYNLLSPVVLGGDRKSWNT